MAEKKSKVPMIFLIFIVAAIAYYLVAGDEEKQQAPDYSGIETASSTVLSNIKNGIRKDSGVKVSNCYTSEKDATRNAVYVACKMKGPGVDNLVGVWAFTGKKSSPGLHMSVNAEAKSVSEYPDSSKTKLNLSATDYNARLVKNYVEKEIYKK